MRNRAQPLTIEQFEVQLLTPDFSGAAVKAAALATRVAITASFILVILVLKSKKDNKTVRR